MNVTINILFCVFSFYALGGDRGDCGEHGNTVALLSAI